MTISKKAGKAKGRKFQQWVAHRISSLLDIPWGPDELIASRPMSQGGVDIILKGEALEKFPFSVECKRQEVWQIPQWIEQAKKNTTKDTDWLLFIKKSLKDSIVVMDADAFFKLMNRTIDD